MLSRVSYSSVDMEDSHLAAHDAIPIFSDDVLAFLTLQLIRVEVLPAPGGRHVVMYHRSHVDTVC